MNSHDHLAKAFFSAEQKANGIRIPLAWDDLNDEVRAYWTEIANVPEIIASVQSDECNRLMLRVEELEAAIVEWSDNIGDAKGVLFDPPDVIMKLIEASDENSVLPHIGKRRVAKQD